MNILCVNTCLKESDVALICDEKIYRAKKYENIQHSLTLMTQIEEVMNMANLNQKDLNYLCVSIGPGSFTGIRIGLAVAKGMSEALNIPIIPLTAFNLIAYNIDTRCDYVVLKGVGDDFYVADYVGKGDVANLRLMQKSQLQEIAKGKKVASNEKLSFENIIEIVVDDVRFDMLPRENLENAKKCEDVEPIYLRKPQAELQKKGLQ